MSEPQTRSPEACSQFTDSTCGISGHTQSRPRHNAKSAEAVAQETAPPGISGCLSTFEANNMHPPGPWQHALCLGECIVLYPTRHAHPICIFRDGYTQRQPQNDGILRTLGRWGCSSGVALPSCARPFLETSLSVQACAAVQNANLPPCWVSLDPISVYCVTKVPHWPCGTAFFLAPAFTTQVFIIY
jgi:hypothetical protein